MSAFYDAKGQRMAQEREDLRSRLKELAKRKGAVAFGIASVEEFDNLPPIKVEWPVTRYTKELRSSLPEARSAIVFGVESTDDADELEIIRSDGSFEYPGYLPLSIIMRDLIQLLRREGYKASFPSVLASHKRLAILAGIGNYGKSSLIISPRHGPWLRLGAVLTDAPLVPDKPFKKDLCGRCERCVNACPVGALEPYVVNPEKCLVAASERPKPPPKVKKLLDKYSIALTPQTRVMCTMCQQVCRYTSAERRKNLISSKRR